MLVALLALVVAMSGTGYAAVKLSRNSVQGKHGAAETGPRPAVRVQLTTPQSVASRTSTGLATSTW